MLDLNTKSNTYVVIMVIMHCWPRDKNYFYILKSIDIFSVVFMNSQNIKVYWGEEKEGIYFLKILERK